METIPLPTLPMRKADSHKGDYGKVLVIAGSDTMIGAPGLVALAALRTGSGLVRIAAPKEIVPAILTLCPLATAFPWSATRIKELLTFADQHDALVVGPGLGASAAVKRLVLELVERHHGPMVFDADALNVLARLETSEWPKRRNWGNIVMTPHMGEYMRLIAAVMKRGANVALAPEAGAQSSGTAQAPPTPGRRKRTLVEPDDAPSTADGVALDMPVDAGDAAAPVPAGDESGETRETTEPDRTPLAELLARGTGSVVVLKGHRSVITDGLRVAVNSTGNPAMATAGSGDVLAGIIASLLGQRLGPLDAAVLGTHVHGLAGDLARQAIAPHAVGIVSSDIIERIPLALSRHIAAVD